MNGPISTIRIVMRLASLIVGLVVTMNRIATAQATPNAAPDQVLTLQQALDIALRNNRPVAISALGVEQAKHRVAEARTSLLPQLDIKAAGGVMLDTVNTHFPAGILGSVNGSPVPSKDIDVKTNHHFTSVYNITLAQPVTQIPRIQTGIRLASVGTDIAREAERQQRIKTTSSVRQFYFAIQQTQEGIKAANASLKSLHELERSVADNVVQQAALRADLLDVQSRVAAQETGMSALMDALQESKEKMNLLLGRDVKTAFQVAPEAEESPLDVDKDQLQEQALRDRPDLKQSFLHIKLAELEKRNVRLGYVPDLSVGMSYTALGTGINGLPDHSWTAGFFFSWKDPWDWGRRRHEFAEKSKAIDQAKLAHEEAKSTAQIDLNNQIRRESQAREQLRSAKSAQEAANERLRVTLNQYQAKEALLKDVLQSQSALADADRRVQDAGLELRTAQSELRRALGRE